MAGTKRGMPYERTGPFPLDDTFVLSKAEMLTVDDLKMPDVYFAACSDDKQFYMYDKSATPSAETGKFKVLEGGGSGNIVELTQAEYDALTDEQKMDGTVYFITDGAGGGGGGTGHGIPVGGLTGQYLVKKTDDDFDAEWADIDIPEGWGVDKTGNIQMTLTNMSANQYIWLGNNYVTSIDDYMVSVDIIGGPESAWGHPDVMVTNKALDHFRIGVHTDIADPAWFKVNYIVFKKDAGGLSGGKTYTAGNGIEIDGTVINNALLNTYYVQGALIKAGIDGSSFEWDEPFPDKPSDHAWVFNYANGTTKLGVVFVDDGASPEAGRYRLVYDNDGVLIDRVNEIQVMGRVFQILCDDSNITTIDIYRKEAMKRVTKIVKDEMGNLLPAGGLTDQILAKASNDDGDARWTSDTGKVLIKNEYAWGSYTTTSAITTLPAEKLDAEGPHGVPTFSINKTSEIQSFEDFRTKLGVNFDITGEFYANGTIYSVPNYTVSSPEADGSFWVNPTEYIDIPGLQRFLGIYIKFISESGDTLIFEPVSVTNNFFYSKFYYPVISMVLVAKEGSSVGTTSHPVPRLVSNLTGMVLEDLKLTKSTIPTTWGVARIDNIKMYMTNKQSYQYLWIGDLGFTSVDDYAIFVDITGGMDAAWGKPTVIVSNKSATEAGISLECDSAQAEWFNVNYVIIGKGYGNLIGANNATLESPNGTKYRLKVADDGTLSTEVV